MSLASKKTTYLFENKRDLNKEILKSKKRRVAKIIQKWACKQLDIKPINCQKYKLSRVLAYLSYPIILENNCDVSPVYSTKYFARAKHAKTWQELADRVCGRNRPKGVNRKLGQLIASKQFDKIPEYLLAYKLHRKMFDINRFYRIWDNLVKLNDRLCKIDYDTSGDVRYNKFKTLHSVIGEERLTILIEKMLNGGDVLTGSYYFKDFIDQWEPYRNQIDISDKNLNTFHKLHDYVSKEFRKLRNPDYSLGVDDKILAKLDNVEVGNLRIVVPKSSHELIEWGQKLNNCIAGFAQSVKDKHCLLLGVVKNNELTYAIEISKSLQVTQFYGNRNSHPDPQDKKLIIDKLYDLKIIQKTYHPNASINAGDYYGF